MSLPKIKTRTTAADYFLIVALVLFNAWLYLEMGTQSRPGDWVIIEVNRQEVKRLPLYQDRLIHVHGTLGVTDVAINQGRARILRSPCNGKVCVKSGYIQYADRLIACIPNRVVVRVEGKAHRGVDAVVG